MPTFEQWWEKHEAQYSADACHMSEFHMASTVWAAAVAAERERCAKLRDGIGVRDDFGGFAAQCAAVIRKDAGAT